MKPHRLTLTNRRSIRDRYRHDVVNENSRVIGYVQETDFGIADYAIGNHSEGMHVGIYDTGEVEEYEKVATEVINRILNSMLTDLPSGTYITARMYDVLFGERMKDVWIEDFMHLDHFDRAPVIVMGGAVVEHKERWVLCPGLYGDVEEDWIYAHRYQEWRKTWGGSYAEYAGGASKPSPYYFRLYELIRAKAEIGMGTMTIAYDRLAFMVRLDVATERSIAFYSCEDYEVEGKMYVRESFSLIENTGVERMLASDYFSENEIAHLWSMHMSNDIRNYNLVRDIITGRIIQHEEDTNNV